MPWTLARDLLQAAHAARRAELRDASIALRAAQADTAGWEQWMREVGGD